MHWQIWWTSGDVLARLLRSNGRNSSPDDADSGFVIVISALMTLSVLLTLRDRANNMREYLERYGKSTVAPRVSGQSREEAPATAHPAAARGN
jgi:hypothetical protein